jgi:hypothetical protein
MASVQYRLRVQTEDRFGERLDMQGYTSRSPYYNVTSRTESTWVGRRVNYNGTSHHGTVLRAFWQGRGKAVALSVEWDGNPLVLSNLTDSEHVTIVKESK